MILYLGFVFSIPAAIPTTYPTDRTDPTDPTDSSLPVRIIEIGDNLLNYERKQLTGGHTYLPYIL
jgi:hypothetical protein